MIETNEQIQEEEPQIAIVDDIVDEKTVESDAELDKYTKNVSKRINTLNQRNKEVEQRALNAERLLAQKHAENQQLLNQTQHLSSNILVAEEQSINAKEAQAEELYKKAVNSGDAELMSKADTLKSDLSIQKEKLRVAKNRQQTAPATQEVEQPVQQQPVQQQVQPTAQAKDWASKNTWYGDQSDQNNIEGTQYAYYTHFNLVNEGFEADSDDYYNELNRRVFKVYPDLDKAEKNAETNDAQPAVQRVASTSMGSRQKTQAKKNGVTFSKSEINRLKGLKPHNMSEKDWLQRVAKEKQKISQREVL
jgi:hypothetical protein